VVAGETTWAELERRGLVMPARAQCAKGGRVAYPNGAEPEPRVRSGVRLSSYNVVVDPKAIDKLNRLIEAGPFEERDGHSHTR
jgi:hypothetical protein